MELFPLGKPTCEVPMWKPRLLSTRPSLLAESPAIGSRWPLRWYIGPDCSATITVFDVPSVMDVMVWPRPRVITPPSETGPRNWELASIAEEWLSDPRMHV